MNATETIILECNNAESIKAKTLGGLSSFTKLDKSTWTNNFESIEIKRGDALTMEYAIINQLGGSSDAIEFSPPTEQVPDKEYNGNSVIFEVEFYVNHNGINSVGLPFGATDALTTPMGTQTVGLNQFNLNRPTYPTGFVPSSANIATLKTSNRLLMTDCRKYTLLHPRFDTIFGTPAEFLRTDKRYIQYQQEKNFISPDNLANELTIKFHETNTNPPKLHASQLITGDTYEQIKADEALGIIKPCSFISYPNAKPLQVGAFYTLNKNTYISRYCNLQNTIVNPDGTFNSLESDITDQMAVLNPYKWINGIHFNNCSTNDLTGDTDYNPTPVAQVYPRIISRYTMNVAPFSTNLLPFDDALGVYGRTLLEENMAIFTNIEATTDNLANIKLYFDSICKYYGSDLDEKEARKDKDNWSCILDIGRTDQSLTDNGTEIGTQPPSAVWGLTGTFVCPTTSKKANNEDLDPTINDGENFYDGSIGVKPFFKDIVNEFSDYVEQITSRPPHNIVFDVDDAHILFDKDVIQDNEVIYEYAKTNNIGAYPYSYIDHAGTATPCLCFLVSKTAINHLPTYLSIGNYIGFSPSFYDNSAVLMINKDISTPNSAHIPNQNPFMNVGASDVNISYSPALSAFGFGSLHTQRRQGWKDNTTITKDLGNPIVVINEVIGGTNNINALNGRANTRLNRDGNTGREFVFQDTSNDINIGYSDSIAGIWIKDIYFGKTSFNPNQYTSAFLLHNPEFLDKIAVKSSPENWYGSLLWKMGAEYIDFFSQFTNLSRGLRFNNNFWRNQSTIRSVAPLTTNSDIDCSTAPFLNIGGKGQPANNGSPNYGLGYDNNEALLLGGIGSAEMIFSGEIKRSETGFYRVYTDFCNPTYLDGDGGQLNVIALALKSYNSNDFFYSYSPSYTMIADRDYVLSSITTSIRNSDGQLANVGDRCVIVYKITKPKLILQPSAETKQSEEGDLEEIVDELKELNTTTAMNNILLRGGSGQSSGGGGGRSSGGLGKDRLRQGEIKAINRNRGTDGGAIINIGGDDVELPSSSSFIGVGRRLDEDLIGEVMEEEGLAPATKEAEEIATKEAEPLTEVERSRIDFRNIDFREMKDNLTKQLILNILNRIPTADLIDRHGNFDYRQYITIAGEVIPDLYNRFSRNFNSGARLIQQGINDRSGRTNLEELVDEVSQSLGRMVGGVEINPEGRSFLSIPAVSRRTQGAVGNLDAEIAPEALEVLLGDLRSGEASAGDIQQVLEDFVGTDSLTVNYQGEPIQMIDNLPDRAETRQEREQRLGSLRGRYLPNRVSTIIQNARENSDGTSEGAIEWINQQLRNIVEAPRPSNREARLQQQQYIDLLGDSRYYLITGNRQPRPLTRESVEDLHDRRVRQRRAEDRRFAEVQATDEPEHLPAFDIMYDPIAYDATSSMPSYARARATRQLQEIVNQQPEPPQPDIQTFKEERPRE
jgi:hypothetical protein